MFIARPLFNDTPEDRFRDFAAATLALVASRHFAQVGDTLDAALNRAYREFNIDSRPNGKEERSLSVGDVVQIFDSTAGTVSFHAVESTGFRDVVQIDVVRALRRDGDGKSTRDAQGALPFHAAIRVAREAVTPETALEQKVLS